MTRTTEDKLLLLKGQIRNDIRSIRFSQESNHYLVTFDNGRMFKYNPVNVVTLVKGEDYPMPVRVTRISDGLVFHNVLGVTSFISPSNQIGAYRVIFDNGNLKDYLASDILVEKHVESEKVRNVFNYLRELSNFSQIAIDDDLTVGLFQKYARVKMIAENSPLADYLVKKCDISNSPVLSEGASYLIFPFGCNRSQYKAVKNALNNKISVIQGPPGTGKTQTILNIVANLLLTGKSVQIVSNNNSAVANVAEKVQKEKYNLYWLASYLGNSANKKAFYEGQTGLYPDLCMWKSENLDKLREEITRISARLLSGYENQERLAELREGLRQTRAQNAYISAALGSEVKVLDKIKSSKEAQSLLSKLEYNLARKGNIGFFLKWKLKRKGITDPSEGQKFLQKTFYQRTIEELEHQIKTIETDVVSISKNEELLENYSLKYLHGVLFKRFRPDGRKRQVFDQAEVERFNPQTFLKEYPVVLSTTFSATTNISQGVPFDYVIMDEASQVDVPAGALAMNVARNAVIVGDEKQLPNVVTTENKIAADMLIKKYDIPPQYDYTRYSFLSSLCAIYPDIPTTMLREHYRCSPAIIEFCNRQFYGGSLIAMTKEGDYPSLKICTTGDGNFARGTANRRQAEMIVKEIIPDVMKDFSDVGVIAPYNEQVQLIRKELSQAGYSGIPVATVHKFQGRENDVIILSTVDNQIREFVDDPHLLNVAVSRAKKLFILVVSGNEQPDSNIKDLYNYIRYNNGEIFTTSLFSIFDLLYASKTKERRRYLSSRRKDSKFASENLMFALLEDILNKPKYSRYAFVSGYPLNLLIPDSAPLNTKEFNFVRKSWSHIDFLLYDKVALTPILAIEVDGTAFHFEGSDQSKRDRIKDSTLSKVGLPMLRLSTDGSGEKEKIEAFIEDVAKGLYLQHELRIHND